MKAAVLSGINTLGIDHLPNPVAAPGEVLVRLRAAALNHRDVWIKTGQYAGLKFPIVPGSDGAGEVCDTGTGVDRDWIGREVIINPGLDWGHQEKAQELRFSILGLPKDGTLAEYIHVPVSQITLKPAHLSWEEAAALPLAGLTAYRALFSRARLEAHEKILITGIGAGTALFALQFALAAGAIPFVTSSSPEKLARARQMGARHGILYTSGNWAREFGDHYGPFDVVIDSAGGPGFAELVDLCAPGGRLVFFGATRGNAGDLPLRKLFWRQVSLLGSTMGSPSDFEAMVKMVSTKGIHPTISQVFPLENVADAFELLEEGRQFGKVVVSI